MAHLDDDAFALVLGLQSSRKEVHENLNEVSGKCFRPKVQLEDREGIQLHTGMIKQNKQVVLWCAANKDKWARN